MTTTELLEILNQESNISLDELLKKIPDLTFVHYIDTILERENISKSQIIKKTTLERTYAYQIMNGTKNPNQDKVIQLALALRLDLNDTNRLLTLSRNKSLYPKIKRDALIIYCLKNHYSVMQTNDLLDEYHFQILD